MAISAKLRPLLRPTLAGFVIIALLISALVGWQLIKPKSKTDPYRLAVVERGDLTKTVSASGTVQALVTVQVGSQLSGLVSQVLVDFNSKVTRGQILAVIDSKTYASRVAQGQADLAAAASALDQQKAGLAQAQAQYVVDKANYQRTQSLAHQGFAARQALEQARATLARADAGLALAKAQIAAQQGRVAQSRAALEASRLDLDRTQIISPIDGVVVDRQIDPGQTVAASFQAPVLFRIAQDLSKLQVKIMVDEADIGEVREGQLVRFVVDSYPDETFTGQVTQIRKQPETQQNVVAYAVMAQAANVQGKLLPGMTANADIIIEQHHNVLKVPAAALRYRPADLQTPVFIGHGSDQGSGGRENVTVSASKKQSKPEGEDLLDQLNLDQDQRAKATPIIANMRQALQSQALGEQAKQNIRGQAYQALGKFLHADQIARLKVFASPPKGVDGKPRPVHVVWLLRNSTPWPVSVEVGASDGLSAEVRGDLQPGDQVIIGGGPKAALRVRTLADSSNRSK